MGAPEERAALEAAERVFLEWVVDEFRLDREEAERSDERGGEAA